MDFGGHQYIYLIIFLKFWDHPYLQKFKRNFEKKKLGAMAHGILGFDFALKIIIINK